MPISIMQKVLVDGKEETVVGFEKIDGETLVVVAHTNSLGEYHRRWVPQYKVIIKQEATIV